MDRSYSIRTLALLCAFLALPSLALGAETETYRVVETIEVDTVPSWFPVGFSLLTRGEEQFASYYNAKHQMIIAHRQMDERTWHKVELPSKVGWDSHNYVTMAVDTRGDIHLAGNMHCVPLIYFRTRTPGDIRTFERLPMTGEDEKRCTYPRFRQDLDGNLVFLYRSGGSGNGRRFFNRYDVATRTWRRFLGGPLFEGQGKRNAYPLGPTRGPDGRFHLVWVWRDTPDCATNHHLSYARSRDLEHWETAGGKPIEVPFLLENSGTWIDAIPSGGGIINGCERLAFDSHQRPVVAYHKLDENRHMQIFVARFESGEWRSRAITSWDKTIEFSGRGAMPFIGIRLGTLRRLESDEFGKFAVDYHHRDYGTGLIVIDEAKLAPVLPTPTVPRDRPASLYRLKLDFDGIRPRFAEDLGEPPNPTTRYLLRWETLGAHHDRPRTTPLPPASALQLIKLEKIGAVDSPLPPQRQD